MTDQNYPPFFTEEQMTEFYKKNGHENYDVLNNIISWKKNDLKQLIKAQLDLNDIILNTSQFKKGEYQYVKKKY